MNFYEMPNSALQLNKMAEQQARLHNEIISNEQIIRERREKLDKANLDSAEDLRRMLEMMEADQKEQAEENKKNRELALKSYKVSLAAAIFGGASFLAAFITLVLQWLG